MKSETYMNSTRDCPQVAEMRPFLMQKRQEESTLREWTYDLQRFDGDAGDAAAGDTGSAPAAKTAEDISAALAGLEDGEALVAGFKAIADGNAKSKSELTKLRGQVTRLTNANKKVTQERDAFSGNFNKLMDFNGIPADTEDLDAAIEELRAQRGKNKDTDIAVLQSKNNDLTRKLKSVERERDEQKKTAEDRLGRIHGIIRHTAVENALKKSGAIEYETLVPIFNNSVSIGEDETPVFTLEDGSQVTVDEGVKMFFEKHPRLLANNQRAGAGSGGGAPGKLDFASMSQAQYEKMRREGKL